jgi:ferredoxin
MSAHVTFESTGLSGWIAEGTYLIDAARRFGIYPEVECGRQGKCKSCAFEILSGIELLSDPTQDEREQLGEQLIVTQRLSCQSRIEREGDLVMKILPEEEKQEETDPITDFRKKFKELPLEKKLSTLVQLEAMAAYQTLNAIGSLPSSLGEKLLGLLANRGRKLEKEDRESKRPRDHINEPEQK